MRTANDDRTAPGAERLPWAGRLARGATRAPGGVRFAVFAEADALRVRLVHRGTRELLVAPMAPAPDEPGVWTVEIPGDLEGWAYAYELERGGRTLTDVVDPWARLIRAGRGHVCFDETPVTPRPAFDPAEAVIYEAHVRDFTRDPAGGVSARARGKYPGFAERGAVLDGTILRTGLDHILELGANVVQLMPVHAFSMPYDPDYEWGYMPNDFNAPHDRYAGGVEWDAPVKEFKALVSALHDAGLRVTLDVVYNHNAERWPTTFRSLMALAPRSYFRFDADGEPFDGSACGNEYRSDSDEGRRFLVDSVRSWVLDYGVDGYRFDLMGLIDVETMTLVAETLRDIDPTVLVYGEPWAGGPAGIPVNAKGEQRGRGWACFNDDLRDGLRGRVFDLEDQGFLTTGARAGDVKGGIVGGVRTFADAPGECVNYIECHDNHTLEDRLLLMTASTGGVSDEDLERMSRLGILTVMVSQGLAFLHSGQEFGRRKAGEDNTYNLGDEVNNLPWALKRERHDRFEFHRDAIAMRRAHPMFRLTEKDDVERAVRFLDDDLGVELPDGLIAFTLDDVKGRDTWKRAFVALNGVGRKRTVFPVEGSWRVATIDGVFAPPGSEAGAGDRVELGPHSGAVLFEARD